LPSPADHSEPPVAEQALGSSRGPTEETDFRLQ
jgi:hypothetical protein